MGNTHEFLPPDTEVPLSERTLKEVLNRCAVDAVDAQTRKRSGRGCGNREPHIAIASAE